MHLLSFILAEKEYAVGIESVREVRRLKEVTPIPKTMDFIEGVVSLRGKVVPIINLRKKLGIPAPEKANLRRILIMEAHGHTLGITVDSVVGILNLEAAHIEAPDEVLGKATYLTGVGRLGKRLVLIIDIEKLLSGEDHDGIARVHKKVEVRKRS
jgi:purine-binding chemotaxis protein CheW